MKLIPVISIMLLSACGNVVVSSDDATAVASGPQDFKATGLEAHARIDQHLEAYISNDFEGFRALFHEEVEVYDFPNKLLFTGLDDFDKAYEKLVSKISKSAFISKRIVEGNFIVDMEVVKVQVPGVGEQIIEGLVIYQMKDNLIYRMMFLDDS